MVSYPVAKTLFVELIGERGIASQSTVEVLGLGWLLG
jgi:hypothetical protein